MQHLDEGTLHALLDGEIPSRELTGIQSHLAGCAECRSRLEAERGLASEALSLVQTIELPEDSAPGTRRSALGPRRSALGTRQDGGKSWVWGLAWAASLAGAVGLGYAVRGLDAPAAGSALDAADPFQARETAGPAADRSLAAGAPDSGTLPAPARDLEPAPRQAAPRRTSLPVPSSPTSAKATTGQEAGAREQAGAVRREDAASDVPRPAAAPLPAESRAVANLQGRVAAEPLPVRAEAGGADSISFPEALRRLNGSIRLIPGLVPLRLEAIGPFVVVVYPVPRGELRLMQQVVDGQLVHQLIGPRGFPADSLELLRARVRE